MGVPYSIFCCFKSTTEARLIDLEAGGGGGGTYSTDVNTMLASADNAGIRTSIGLGITSTPTFAGASFNGSFTGGSGGGQGGIFNEGGSYVLWSSGGVGLSNRGYLGFGTSNNYDGSAAWNVRLYKDDAGILAQRYVGNTQVFRLYNGTDSIVGGVNPINFDRASFSFTSGNFRIAAEYSNTGAYTTARGIDFATGGAVRMSIAAAGNTGVGDVTATGTRSPSAPFEVIKSTVVNGPMLVLRGDISGVGKWSSIAWGDQSQTNAFRKGAIIYESLHASVRGKLHISLNNTDGADSAGLSDARLTIAADGAVGVGASSPVNRLDIAETWNTIINVTGASGSGTIATITFATQTQVVPIGSTIVVAGINPAGYNGTFVVIASSTTALTYANATTATYVSGGTIERVFTSVKLNVTDTASYAASKLMDLQVGGVSKFQVGKGGDIGGNSLIVGGSAVVSSNGIYGAPLGWPASPSWGGITQLNMYSGSPTTGFIQWNNELFLYRDAAGILAQRNGFSPQTFRVYNTYTDASNYERGVFDFRTTTNTLRIGTELSGTGQARPIEFVTGGVVRMSIAAAGYVGIGTTTPSERLEIWGNAGQTTAKITSVSPGTGSNFILSGAFGQVYNEIGDLYITNNAASSSVVIRAGGAGAQLRFTPAGLLQLGGTTSAFPAIARSGTGIAIVAADNSQFVAISSLYQRFGTGTPEGVVNAPAGAIYHRSDGGTGTSFYVKESPSGSTGWVAK